VETVETKKIYIWKIWWVSATKRIPRSRTSYLRQSHGLWTVAYISCTANKLT